MGRRINEMKQAPNLALAFIFFVSIAAAGFSYMYVKKPAIKIDDAAIAGFLIMGLVSLFFFARSLLTPRRSETQPGAPKGYYINPEEPFGC